MLTARFFRSERQWTANSTWPSNNVRYSYSFLQDDRVDFAGSVGLHVTDIGLAVSAAGIGAAGDSVTAPLPLIGGRLDVALTHKWTMRSSVELMYVEVGDFKGQISDMLLAAEYRAWKNFAIGGGLNAVRIALDVDDDSSGVSFEGSLQSDFVGRLFTGKMNVLSTCYSNHHEAFHFLTSKEEHNHEISPPVSHRHFVIRLTGSRVIAQEKTGAIAAAADRNRSHGS